MTESPIRFGIFDMQRAPHATPLAALPRTPTTTPAATARLAAVPAEERLPTNLQSDMERTLGTDFSQVRIHADTRAARAAAQYGAAAYALGEHIRFAAGRYRPDEASGRVLIAHELAHVAQQRIATPAASPAAAETEARLTARRAVRGQPAPVQQSARGVQRQGSPHDRMVVDRARRRLALLEQFVGQWQEREARRLRIGRERDSRLAARTAMDRQAGQSGADLNEAVMPGGREASERALIAQLNRRPLRISMTEDAVTIRVRFHLRFEDPAMAGQAAALAVGLRQGLDTVWNQRLTGDVFDGRRLQVVAETVPVAADAARDQNFWLITVRASDSAPITYPGCDLPDNPSGVPTSVTDATCDGGVMSIPPHHISMGGVLGHELLHLLGLVDRYMNTVSVQPGAAPVNENHPTRETPDRLDPLGAEDGPVLREDLAFLFEHLGVYEMEANRALDMLARLEREGMRIGRVRGEMIRLQEIIDLGYDARSLIRPRTDFTDRMLQDAEDL